jgi:hypothetical protein
VHVSHIHRLTDRGEIPSKRLGSAKLIPLDWVREWERQKSP